MCAGLQVRHAARGGLLHRQDGGGRVQAGVRDQHGHRLRAGHLPAAAAAANLPAVRRTR